MPPTMIKLHHTLNKIKIKSPPDLKKGVFHCFIQDIMQREHNSNKDHSTAASYVLFLLIYYFCNDPEGWRIKNHLREDYGLDPLTNYGYIYKSAQCLSDDIFRQCGYRISRQVIQRILKIYTKNRILRCKGVIGATNKTYVNGKRVGNRTKMYRLDFKVLGEFFPDVAFTIEELMHPKNPPQSKVIAPVLETLEKVKKKTPVDKWKKGLSSQELIANGDYLERSKQKKLLLISLLRSAGYQGFDLEFFLPRWREHAASIGVKRGELDLRKKICEAIWKHREWWLISIDGWRRIWDGWCANWVQWFQEKFGKKRRAYEEPPAYFQVLNDQVVTNREHLKKTDVSFDEPIPIISDLLTEKAVDLIEKGITLTEEIYKELKEKYG